ncbi:MAG: 2-dehydropantoate 2-reductase [Gammaproteobacteria bacterium]
MQFTLVGAGALGTILGAHLIAAGHDVRLIARGRRALQLADEGLKVRGLTELALPCEAVTKPDPTRDRGVLIFAVKTYHMDAALEATGELVPHAVFSLANGVMKNEQLARAFGRDRVLGCMANFSGELEDDGAVLFTRNVMLYLGGPNAAAKELASVIDAAGINTEASPHIETVEWSKFVGWLALFALAVIARSTTGRCLDNLHFAHLGVAVIREAAAIAEARGITLIDQSPVPVRSLAMGPFREAVERLRQVGREMHETAPKHRMSALQDLEAGRELEVHETLGYAVREAARLGVDAPTLALCYEIGAGLNTLRTAG